MLFNNIANLLSNNIYEVNNIYTYFYMQWMQLTPKGTIQVISIEPLFHNATFKKVIMRKKTLCLLSKMYRIL